MGKHHALCMVCLSIVDLFLFIINLPWVSVPFFTFLAEFVYSNIFNLECLTDLFMVIL